MSPRIRFILPWSRLAVWLIPGFLVACVGDFATTEVDAAAVDGTRTGRDAGLAPQADGAYLPPPTDGGASGPVDDGGVAPPLTDGGAPPPPPTDGGRPVRDGGSAPPPMDGGSPIRDSGSPPPPRRDAGPTSAIIVDHTTVELFERIPTRYVDAARNLKQMFSDRSVGQNINESLDCLAAATYGTSPNSCRRDLSPPTSGAIWTATQYDQEDFDAGRVPTHLRFSPSPARYDRSNWIFEANAGSWEEIIEHFITDLGPRYVALDHDVLSFQFSYLNIDHGSNIANGSSGFFVDLPHGGPHDRWDISDLEDWERDNPGRTFIYWTTSLARSLGSVEGEQFNDELRAYAHAHDKVLFDVADIEAHDPAGRPCYDNRDGVRYCQNASSCEDHGDDGLNTPAICQHYTTEVEGGHLATGGARVAIAKAFWVLMARIAGWDGVSP